MPLESFLKNFRGAYFVKKKLGILNYMYEETNNNIWSKILKITNYGINRPGYSLRHTSMLRVMGNAILTSSQYQNYRRIDLIVIHCSATGYNQHSIGVCYEGGLDIRGRPSDTRTSEQKENYQ